MAGTTGESLGWDDEVQASNSEYTVLAPGKYTYRVDKFERQRFDGSERMTACPMALLTLSCANAKGETGSVQVRLYLNKRQAWKLTQFFKSCWLIDPGTADGASYRMPWGQVVGATGELELSNRTYDGRTYNDVRRFVVPPAPAPAPAAAAAKYGAL
jgi:hypothetical protein